MRLRNVSAAQDHQPSARETGGPGTGLLSGRAAKRPGRGSHRERRRRVPGGVGQRPVRRTAVEGPHDRLHQIRDLRVRNVARTVLPGTTAFQPSTDFGDFFNINICLLAWDNFLFSDRFS